MFLYYWNAFGFIEFFCTLLCILSFVLVWSLTFHHLLFCKCFLLFLCSITLGGFGVDRFYLGLWREGIGKLFSFGGLGVWTIVDVILIAVGYIGPQDGSLYIWVGASSTMFFFFLWQPLSASESVLFLQAVLVFHRTDITHSLRSSDRIQSFPVPVLHAVNTEVAHLQCVQAWVCFPKYRVNNYDPAEVDIGTDIETVSMCGTHKITVLIGKYILLKRQFGST